MHRDDNAIAAGSKSQAVHRSITSVTRIVKTGWRHISQAQNLPDYALHYYDSLKATFETLPRPPRADANAVKAYRDAAEVAAIERGRLTWSDLMQLDLSMARSLGFNALRLKIADLRVKLDGSVAPLPNGLVSKLDSTKASDLEALRAEAENLVTRVWHQRMARHARDRYVGELRRTLFTCLICIVALFLAVSLALEKAPLYFVIITAGMLGALTSFLRRMEMVLTTTPNPEQSTDLSALAYARQAAILSLLSGGVFAIVMYCALVAGLAQLSGELAPKFAYPPAYPKTGTDFLVFVLQIGPTGGPDYAKVIIWSFIAGFFEQFVPDVLDRVVKKK